MNHREELGYLVYALSEILEHKFDGNTSLNDLRFELEGVAKDLYEEITTKMEPAPDTEQGEPMSDMEREAYETHRDLCPHTANTCGHPSHRDTPAAKPERATDTPWATLKWERTDWYAKNIEDRAVKRSQEYTDRAVKEALAIVVLSLTEPNGNKAKNIAKWIEAFRDDPKARPYIDEYLREQAGTDER